LLGFHTALPILNLEPLDSQIGALSESHLILAETSILRSLGYSFVFKYMSIPNQLEDAGLRTLKLSLIRDAKEPAISGRVTAKKLVYCRLEVPFSFEVNVVPRLLIHDFP
jgi:hypothetical protein